MGTGYGDPGSLGIILYLQDIDLDPLRALEYLALYLFGFRQDGVDLSKIHADVPSDIALHDTGHYLLLPALPLV